MLKDQQKGKTKIRTSQNDINGGHSSHTQHKVITQIKPDTIKQYHKHTRNTKRIHKLQISNCKRRTTIIPAIFIKQNFF